MKKTIIEAVYMVYNKEGAFERCDVSYRKMVKSYSYVPKSAIDWVHTHDVSCKPSKDGRVILLCEDNSGF